MKKYTIDTDEQKSTHLDFQFMVIVYLRDEYQKDKTSASNLYSDFGGVEFGNSWREGIEHAKKIVEKNPEHLAVVYDRMRRKQSLEI